MSAIVGDILTNVRAQAASILTGWQRLPYVFDVSKNNSTRAKLAYGVRALDASPADGVNRCYTLDHRFELILTDTIARGNDDSLIETSIGTLFDKSDEMFKALVHTKISLPLVVLNISSPSLLPPELYEKEKIVAVRMQFNVSYRSALN